MLSDGYLEASCFYPGICQWANGSCAHPKEAESEVRGSRWGACAQCCYTAVPRKAHSGWLNAWLTSSRSLHTCPSVQFEFEPLLTGNQTAVSRPSGRRSEDKNSRDYLEDSYAVL